METNKDYPIQNIIGDISKGVNTQHSRNKVCNFVAFASKQFEPKLIDEVIDDKHWSLSMQEDLNRF